MALRFIDSFDHYGTADLQGTGGGQKWTSYFNSGAGVSQISSNGRFGNCLYILSSSGNTSYITKTLDNQATWIIGFSYKATTFLAGVNNQLVALYDSGTAQCDLRVNTNGQLYVTRSGTILGTSTNTITINTWNYIELKITINNTTGSYQINLNGVNILSATGQNTRNTTNNYANQIILGGKDGYSGTTVYYDDFYVCDGTGSTNNDFLGDVRVECRFPSATGTNTDWTINGANAVGCVNDIIPNGDNNFISSSTTNQISTFSLQPLASTPGTVFGIQNVHISRKSDAGARNIATATVSGSATNVSSNDSLNTTYSVYAHILETDPNTSAAWTLTALNNMEVGVKEIT